MIRRSLIVLALVCIALGLNAGKECRSPGIKRDISPGKFGVCVEREGKLVYVENQCSKGLIFDPVQKSCKKIFPRALILQEISSNTLGNSTASYQNGTTTEQPRTTRLYPSTHLTQPCRGPGAYCSDCNTLSFCVSSLLPDGKKILKTILGLMCTPDSVCVTQQGCVKKYNGGLCREGPFTCGDVGLYPDLYDCKKFHSCTIGPSGQLTDTPITCSGGLLGNRWNPLTSTCGWPEEHDSCVKVPVPSCTKPLEMKPVGGQIYSICIADETNYTLSPKLFRCPMDSVFNASIYSCV